MLLEMNSTEMLVVKGLKQYFPINKNHVLKAVDDVSFTINRGEFFALVGESGSGKSTIARSIAGINKITNGEIIYNGINIANPKVYKKEKKKIAKTMQLIFQDTTSSLNSRMTIGDIIAEPLVIQKTYKDKKEIVGKVIEMLELVGLDKSCVDKYPYDFSGGQRQRINIARALIIDPDFIIADEPIASLDVSMQLEIIEIFKKLKRERNLTCLFISHDLSMVRYISDRIGVLRKGKLVEVGTIESIYENPKNEYTNILISSILKSYIKREKYNT